MLAVAGLAPWNPTLVRQQRARQDGALGEGFQKWVPPLCAWRRFGREDKALWIPGLKGETQASRSFNELQHFPLGFFC
jgi:hypothetical protein